MHTRPVNSIAWSTLAVLALCASVHASDVLLLHGHIYTGSKKTPWVEAVAVTADRIDAIGSSQSLSRRKTAKTRVIDLHGHTVIPGIVDSHMHMLYGAIALHGINLSTPEASITPDKPEEIVTRIKAYAALHPEDPILIGRADFSAAPPYAPNHELLDRAVSDRPLVIHNTSEHCLWLNARALALAGVADDPVPDPEEERNIIRDASGHPTGVLVEAAMELMERAVWKAIPVEDQLSMLRDAAHYLNRYGITSIVNATGNLAEIRLFGTLRDRGELTVRTRTAFGAVAVPHHLTPKFLADLEEARTTYHDKWVSANLVKFFADGSTGLIPPLVYAPAEYKAIVVELDRRGYQIMTHAQRDDTVHLALDAYAEAVRKNGPRDRRFRVEHDMVISDADVSRQGSLSVIASMQPALCCSDIGTNYDPKQPIPSDRWQTLRGAGVILAFNSDWPCIWPPNPFLNVQESTTREIWHSDDTADIMGEPLDGAAQAGARPTGRFYSPAERITVAQAIDAYTQGSAYASFFDTHVGTIEPGKFADIAVLSQDVFTVPHERIAETKVVLTMVGGRVVHEDWN